MLTFECGGSLDTKNKIRLSLSHEKKKNVEIDQSTPKLNLVPSNKTDHIKPTSLSLKIDDYWQQNLEDTQMISENQDNYKSPINQEIINDGTSMVFIPRLKCRPFLELICSSSVAENEKEVDIISISSGEDFKKDEKGFNKKSFKIKQEYLNIETSITTTPKPLLIRNCKKNKPNERNASQSDSNHDLAPPKRSKENIKSSKWPTTKLPSNRNSEENEHDNIKASQSNFNSNTAVSKKDKESTKISPKKERDKFKLLAQKYHKVTDFFEKTPKQFSISKTNIVETVRAAKMSKSKLVSNVKKKLSQSNNPITKINIKRNLTKSTDLRKVSNRYFSDDQTRLHQFYVLNKNDSLSSYYQTWKTSMFPIMISGDIDIDDFLSMLINEQSVTDANQPQFKYLKENNCIILEPAKFIDDPDKENELISNIDKVLTNYKNEPDGFELELIKTDNDAAYAQNMDIDVISLSCSSDDEEQNFIQKFHKTKTTEKVVDQLENNEKMRKKTNNNFLRECSIVITRLNMDNYSNIKNESIKREHEKTSPADDLDINISKKNKSLMLEVQLDGYSYNKHLDHLDPINKSLHCSMTRSSSKTKSFTSNNSQTMHELPTKNSKILPSVENSKVISITKSNPDQQQNRERKLSNHTINFPPPKSKSKTRSNRKKTFKETTSKGTGRKKIVCPSYKIIDGSTFAVDAFRYGEIESVTHYFLSHFHSDHYIGLKKSFNKPLYMSQITANLVQEFIKVSPEFINILVLDVPVIVKDIEVTTMDANHCPGAVMFLFKFPSGKCILHTGDFRATPQMEMWPMFWNNHINSIYLDTTYLSSKYYLPTQDESIDEALKISNEFIEKHIGMKYLIIVGAYVIGKEKVWYAIAKHYNLKVWLEPTRRRAMKCFGNPSVLELLVDKPEDAQLHVITLGYLFYESLVQYLAQYDEIFTHVLAIRPSGWERKTRTQNRGNIWITGVQYSEHSGFDELRRFVRFLQPDYVISTVPYGSNLSKTPKVPHSWLEKTLKPHKMAQQTKLTNFLKVKKRKNIIRNELNIDHEVKVIEEQISNVVESDGNGTESVGMDWLSL